MSEDKKFRMTFNDSVKVIYEQNKQEFRKKLENQLRDDSTIEINGIKVEMNYNVVPKVAIDDKKNGSYSYELC